MNSLTTALSQLCRSHLLAEKWLIAPTLRAGHQWLVAVTRGGQPVINCHVKTLSNLALELAAPAIAAAGTQLVSARRGALLIDRIIRRLRKPATAYLWQLPPSVGLAESVYAAIDTLRRAGVYAKALRPEHFEVDLKGQELATVMKEYVEELQLWKWIDRAEVLRMATTRLRESAAVLPTDLLVLLPDDISCTGLERSLLEALPAERRQALPVDKPGRASSVEDGATTDARLLSWLPAPTEAPRPVGDGTGAIFRAIGEANEVREVLRRCLAVGDPLDEVEVLVTDIDIYGPLLYEILSGLMPEGANLDDMPVTFQEGIPVRQFRPGRALIAWLAWVRGDYPQPALVQMIQEGLLNIPDLDQEEFSFSRLASVLRGVGIGFGRDRYILMLDEQIAALEERLACPDQLRDEDGEADPARVRGLERRLKAMGLLRGLVARLLDVSPTASSDHLQVLEAARRFVDELARTGGRLDNYARGRLLIEIDDLFECLGHEESSLEVWGWLATLPDEAIVGGSGPQGGCLHVAHILAGGHSGRPHTFLVGLDDSRFPGAGLQDPVLLDSERRQISSDLPTAAGQLQERLKQIALLLARLRGNVTLSYSCHDLADDREMFPSPVVLSAFRILSGRREGDQTDLFRWLPPAASFSPDRPEKALAESEWWLWRLSEPEAVSEPRSLIAACFPHLGRGYEAAAQRASDNFTIFDGWIPAPGSDIDPTAPDGPKVSASRLETLGRCPLAYFFQHVLKIELPEELEIDPDVWLDPLTQGSLLHELFERFLNELIGRGEVPQFNRDEGRLMQILDELLDRQRRLIPAPSEAVFRRQCRQLRSTARIFLREDEEFCRKSGNRPVFVEVSLGMKSDEHRTPLDTEEPVRVALPGGKHLSVRGRIDRVDRVGGATGNVFAIWDYKTGSSWKYHQERPFWEGRVVQHALYLELMKSHLRALRKHFPEARVERFSFFFPSERARGERIDYTPEQLAGGGAILERLAQIAGNGTFLATNCSDDCKYCDYQRICGDFKAVAAASGRKLENPTNTDLQPYRELRTYGEAEE
jgi:ATP-dependent helicase/nuclease subunit B